MSEKVYIKDSHGTQVPLIDDYGNLSMQVIMLYSEDKLTADDRITVDNFVADDEMSREALEGFMMTTNASRTRHVVNEMNAQIQKRSGAQAISPLMPKDENTFEFRKIAAAIGLLVILGGTSFLVSQLWDKDEIAENKQQREIIQPKKVPVVAQPNTLLEVADTTLENGLPQDKTQAQELSTKPEIDPKSDKKKFEDRNQVVIKEKKSSQPALAEPTRKTQEEPESQNVEFDAELADGKESSTSDYDNSYQETGGLVDGLANVEATDSQSEIREKTTDENRDQGEDVALLAAEQGKMASQGESATSARKAVSGGDNSKETTENQSAKYPGGDLKMYKFIERKKSYPKALQEQGITGNITVTFDISEDGRIINAKVKTGVNGILNADALRVVRSMPKWTPAVKNGEPAKSSRSVIIKYGN